MGCGCLVRVTPLDGTVVLVDEVPGLAQQLLRGWRALGGPALQFPWKYQGAQAAFGSAGSILGRGGGAGRDGENRELKGQPGQVAGARVRKWREGGFAMV